MIVSISQAHKHSCYGSMRITKKEDPGKGSLFETVTFLSKATLNFFACFHTTLASLEWAKTPQCNS